MITGTWEAGIPKMCGVRLPSMLLAFALVLGLSLTGFSAGQAKAAGQGPVPFGGGSSAPGAISGSVTGGLVVPAESCSLRIDAHPLDGGSVSSYSPSYYLSGPVSYRFAGLRPGRYKVGYSQGCMVPYPVLSFPSIEGFYNGKSSISSATTVWVEPGAETKEINIPGSRRSISGTVTDSAGATLAGICVEAFDRNGSSVGLVRSDDSGNYIVEQLETPSYRLKFSDCDKVSPTPLAPEFYENKDTLEKAVPVSTLSGIDTTGIDAQLDPPKEPIDPPDPEPAVAKIGKVRITGPRSVKAGRKAAFKVKITNSGSAPATGVKLRVTGRGIKYKTALGKIAARSSRTLGFRVKPRRSGKVRATFRITSDNAGGKVIRRGPRSVRIARR